MRDPERFFHATSGPDAAHRATERRTHLTHWPAAVSCRFSRVRSGCARIYSMENAGFPLFLANTDRVRREGRP